MVLCPPFRWSSKKVYDLPHQNGPSSDERPRFSKVPDIVAPPVLNTKNGPPVNLMPPVLTSRNDQSVDAGTSSNRPSDISMGSVKAKQNEINQENLGTTQNAEELPNGTENGSAPVNISNLTVDLEATKKNSDISMKSEKSSDIKVNGVNTPRSTSELQNGPGSSGQTLLVNEAVENRISDVSTQSLDSILSETESELPDDVGDRQSLSEDEAEEPRRKCGIIEPSSTTRPSLDIPKFEKDDASAEQIIKALKANEFLQNLSDERLNTVMEAMSPEEFPAGSLIIREGDSGSHLFVSASGEYEVVKALQIVKSFGPGIVFGELAILYKAKRFASIRCVTDAKVWMLERRVFQKIMMRSGYQEREDNIRFLSEVEVLKGIHRIEIAKISECLKREFFPTGTAVVRQGERGDTFYIIRGGTVVVTQREADGVDRLKATLRRGDHFGEQALMHTDRRLATVTAQPPGVECLTLDRVSFNRLLGNLDKLRLKKHTQVETPPISKEVDSEFKFVTLQDLEILGTLGVGGFGRVELVRYRPDTKLKFALKCLKKIDMVQQQQQEHAYNEKHIMMTCQSHFIVRLYRTFKDMKYIYLLMEPVLGGDVWMLLQKQRSFAEPVAKFMSACVIEAFHYLHSKNIVYRDLKPENLMLDESGYVKLVDFGFAKYISPSSKTWTFAGTPEYVAPEIVLNKGHDRAVDCWALGVLIHELLTGKAPFHVKGGDHMKTYTLILRGIDTVPFHRVPDAPKRLIRKLCKAVPAERLGYLKGINDIKHHKWYEKFDWEGLREKKMRAPLVPSKRDMNTFEKYPREKLPPDENSGWDIDF